MANLGLRPARLVVQSDRRLGREALAAYFANGRGFTVVGHTDTAHGLRTLCALGRPDLCLIDVEALNARTVRMLRDIRSSFPEIDLVVTYSTLSLELLADAVRGGVTSFVPSSRGLDAITRLLQQRARRARANLPVAAPNGRGLTDRELGVISLMSSGHTVSDIARLLRISPHTVDNHKRRVYAKFGVDSQSLAVSRAMTLGLVEPPRSNGTVQLSRSGHPPLAIISGTGPMLDRVTQALLARGLPYVHDNGHGHLTPDHWSRWHQGPLITVLVDPSGPQWREPGSFDIPLVVVQSTDPDAATVVEVLAAGARALVHATDVPTDLPEVLLLVSRGYVAVSAEHATKLAEWMALQHSDRSSSVPHLTAREQDILSLLARGQTIRQAARTLGIAAKTVENTQARLYRKLGTRNRAETLTVAYRLGLLDPTSTS